MKSRLTLLLPEHWPEPPECEWLQSDRDGRTTQRGRSAPRHWPPADEHVAILDGAQTSLLTITVPPSKRKDRPALITYALEAKLARDVDQEHVTVVSEAPAPGGGADARQLTLLVVAAARLRQICAQFEALQRPLHRAVSVTECLAASAECWQVASGDGRSATLRSGAGSAIAFDLPPATGAADDTPDDDQVDAVVTIVELAVRAAGSVPQGIDLAFSPALSRASCEAIAQRSGITTQATTFDTILTRSAQAHSLLHGTFAPRTGAGASVWTMLRAPLLTAAAALTLAGLAMLVGVLADRDEAARLEKRLDRVFADALPSTPAVVPALQLQRALRDARHAQGELAENDLLSMLGALSDATGSMPTAFTYREQSLSTELTAPPTATAALVRYGLAVETDGTQLMLSSRP
ncbi:type II secretion system protein GspL [Thauera propionica]|uniref:type II secretion system protein GspL n=1 Tax=Thauera propionica TaxID=2019431 RepID=UPI0023F34604|nr:type II secretion system protein GspL [Thauera propionica]MDD3675911.1 type II secretion system protein GspL [Thauera propionica]